MLRRSPPIRRASWMTRASAPEPPPDLTGLRPYQPDAVRFLRARLAQGRNAVVADDMGLGKTAEALRALPARARAMVTCPASVLLKWAQNEIPRWRPDLRVVDYSGRAPREGEIALTSYDRLPDDITDDLSRVIWIWDEGHRPSNPDTRRTRRVRHLVGRCRASWALTGTPMRGTPDDLRGFLETYDLLLECFPGGPDEFRSMCSTKRAMVSPEVAERLRRVMIRRLADDVLDLPPVQWIDVPAAAPRDLREHLDEITRKWREEYDPRALPPFELFSEATAALARSRIDAAIDLVRDVSRGAPTLVFSAHLDPIRAIAERFRCPTITGEEPDKRRRQAAVDTFMSGRADVLAATYEAGGEGQDMQRAGAIVMIDRPWRPMAIDQAIGRARRQGTTQKRIVVYEMISDHPLDVRTREIITDLRRLSAQAIDGREPPNPKRSRKR